MKSKLSATRVFALKGYTVKTDAKGRFFVCPTADTCSKQPTWSGPYKSLQHATTAIARKLAREYTQRDRRLTELKAAQP